MTQTFPDADRLHWSWLGLAHRPPRPGVDLLDLGVRSVVLGIKLHAVPVILSRWTHITCVCG